MLNGLFLRGAFLEGDDFYPCGGLLTSWLRNTNLWQKISYLCNFRIFSFDNDTYDIQNFGRSGKTNSEFDESIATENSVEEAQEVKDDKPQEEIPVCDGIVQTGTYLRSCFFCQISMFLKNPICVAFFISPKTKPT